MKKVTAETPARKLLTFMCGPFLLYLMWTQWPESSKHKRPKWRGHSSKARSKSPWLSPHRQARATASHLIWTDGANRCVLCCLRGEAHMAGLVWWCVTEILKQESAQSCVFSRWSLKSAHLLSTNPGHIVMVDAEATWSILLHCTQTCNTQKLWSNEYRPFEAMHICVTTDGSAARLNTFDQ